MDVAGALAVLAHTASGEVVSYFSGAANPFQPGGLPTSLIPFGGAICLIVGVLLAVRDREPRVLWLLPALLLPIIFPFVLRGAYQLGGNVAVPIAVIVMVLALIGIVLAAIIAARRRRAPFYLGLFVITFGAVGSIAGLFVASGAG